MISQETLVKPRLKMTDNRNRVSIYDPSTLQFQRSSNMQHVSMSSQSSFLDMDRQHDLSNQRLSLNGASLNFIDSNSISIREADFFLVLTSELPFFPLFFKVLRIIHLIASLRRKKYYPRFVSMYKFLHRMDYKNLLYVLNNKVDRILRKLQCTRVSFDSPPLSFKFKHLYINYRMPSKLTARMAPLVDFLHSVVSLVSWKSFNLILTAILLEYSVVIVHPLRSVISDLIFFFSLALRPYTVSYHLIYFLPNQKMDFLHESMQPLIVGCPMSHKAFKTRVNFKSKGIQKRLVYDVQKDRIEFTDKLSSYCFPYDRSEFSLKER